MTEGIKIYKTRDLVLRVKQSYDPSKLNLKKWVDFIDVLCGDREFQKEAIRDAIIFLASGEYRTIEDLVEENYRTNDELQKRYKDVRDYQRDLPLPHKLSAVIDLATGTGKGYVIYGIAQIALGLGLVDKVLVLCPSLTIESGLKEKFEKLSGDDKIKATLPDNAVFKNPRIIDANSTIKNGDICVENIHAAYERTGSSINDSLKGNGERAKYHFDLYTIDYEKQEKAVKAEKDTEIFDYSKAKPIKLVSQAEQIERTTEYEDLASS